MKNIVIVIATFLFLCGCMGDGVLRVAGKLRSEAPTLLTDCKFQLVVPSADSANNEIVVIDPNGFTESFTVAPRDETYPVIITCAGHEPYQDTVTYSPGTPNTKEFGTIMLKVLKSGT